MLGRGLNLAARAAAAVFPSASHAIERRRLATRNVFEEVDHFISPSKFLREFFVQHGLSKGKISFLDNGFEALPKVGRIEKQGWIRFGYLGT